MSAGWEVGDLALCVSDSLPGVPGRAVRVQVGKTYTVTGVYVSSVTATVGLVLAEAKPRKHPGFHEELFRKIKPDAHEACEDEFVTLLERIKRPVKA